MNDESKVKTLVPRVTQLNTCEFDKQIHNLLKSNLLEITEFLTPGALNNVNNEIDLIIKLLVFKYSLLKSNSTFGQQLLNVKYHEELTRKKVIWYSVLNFFIPYFKTKVDNALLHVRNNNVKKILDRCEIIIKLCQFVNLLVFLHQGVFPNLIDRLLGIKIIPKATLNRNVGYGYMTRELLWHGFMELLVNSLPLINYRYLKNKLVNVFSSQKNEMIDEVYVTYKLGTLCKICGKAPVYPCRISSYCEHVACYYCIQSNVMSDKHYTCPCGMENTASVYLEYLN